MIQPKSRQNQSRPFTLPVSSEMELMTFLLASLPGKNRNNIKSLLSNHQVFVEGKMTSQFNFKLKPGHVVQVGGERSSTTQTSEVHNDFSIVFEDDDLIVIDKPAGLLTIATENEKSRTAYHALSAHVKSVHPANKIFIVHRLDRETSGLLLFAKNQHTQQVLQQNWEEIVTERTYVAIVEGLVPKDAGTITSYLHENKALVVYSDQNPKGGKKAITHYKVIRRSTTNSMLEVNLETGRKNQIRVHMQDLGHSIINDKKYGATTNPIGRLGLHAKRLAFTHPVTQKPMQFQTRNPKKFLLLFCKSHQ
ncbi:MAG: RluA family pseudouridine synthase [Bacteroidales bacterium]|nr:RluA family pseudouridine synthase [Bacteroidales bacterium]